MIKEVIFDMDGLLVDTEKISYKCYKSLLERYGYTFTIEEYVKDFAGKQLNVSLNYIKEHYQLDIDIEEEVQIFHKNENDIIDREGVTLKAGAQDLLKYLKDKEYKIVLATSSLELRATKLLSHHNISHYFDACVYGSDVKNGKPFPDVFFKACEKGNVKCEEALVLEDSEAGIQAAHLAHIPVICIPDLKKPSKEYAEKCKMILKSLDEVISFIEKDR